MASTKTQEFSPVWRTPDESHFVITAGFTRRVKRTPVWHPPTDVYEIDTAIVVQIEIAGMRDAEFTVSLDNHTLIVGGVRSGTTEQRAYHKMEIPNGEFLSVAELPVAVDYDKLEAIYQDGFLRIVLPKAIPSRIEIKKSS